MSAMNGTGPHMYTAAFARQAQRCDGTAVQPAGRAGIEHLLSRVGQRGDQVADLVLERLGVRITGGVQPPDFARAPGIGQRVQHRQHRGDADARGQQNNRPCPIGQIEVTARRRDIDDRSVVNVVVQPATDGPVVLALDADSVFRAVTRQRIAAQRCRVTGVGQPQCQVLTRPWNGQGDTVVGFEPYRHDGRAFVVDARDA